MTYKKIPLDLSGGNFYFWVIVLSMMSVASFGAGVYRLPFISDAISNFNSDLYYQNPDYLERSYREGKLLD